MTRHDEKSSVGRAKVLSVNGDRLISESDPVMLVMLKYTGEYGEYCEVGDMSCHWCGANGAWRLLCTEAQWRI